MRLWLTVAIAALAAPLLAQPRSPAERAWNELASADLAAALELIERNHPGAAPELGDTQFQSLLSTARANARKRLPLVRDYGGHAALLNGLANDFRDGHIWSKARISPNRREWAGLVITRIGGHWVVGAQEAAGSEPGLKGARMLGCDGVEADAFARARTGTFHAHPDVEAAMASRAYTMLLDDQNPFVERASACRFQAANGRQIDHRLSWRPVSVRSLERIIGESVQEPAAGMGVSAFPGGQWIALETLGNGAAQVVEAVRARQAALRSSPMVVLDLRGNSGGNSQYALEIARALVGDERAAAADRPAGDCTGMYWRVSEDNAKALRAFVASLPPDRRPEWSAQADALDRAVASGRSFSPDLPACAREGSQPASPGRLPPPLMKGRLVLVTDRACFSSCLMAADLFRRLGATHVGEATDMSTRYMEVREITLPSGLRTFSTLQKVALGAGNFGPYQPKFTYPSSMADTDGLKTWVAALPG